MRLVGCLTILITFGFMTKLIMNDVYGLRKIINVRCDIFNKSLHFNCYV